MDAGFTQRYAKVRPSLAKKILVELHLTHTVFPHIVAAATILF